MKANARAFERGARSGRGEDRPPRGERGPGAAATLIGVFFTPLFYFIAMTYLGGDKRKKTSSSEPAKVES